MKNVFNLMVIALTLLSIQSQARLADKREKIQQDRIANGVQSGELTKGETRRLERGENRIDKAEDKALADGKETIQEKRKINRMQNRESKRIYNDKHNDIKQ